jgi:hypothetical protein
MKLGQPWGLIGLRFVIALEMTHPCKVSYMYLDNGIFKEVKLISIIC